MPPISNAQPARESNIEAIAEYFESGCTPAQGAVGIELEHTVVHDDLAPVTYSEPYGVQWILRQLQEEYPQATLDTQGDLLGVARPREAVTLEPAAQLELSAGPFTSLADAETTFQAFERTLESVLGPARRTCPCSRVSPHGEGREHGTHSEAPL